MRVAIAFACLIALACARETSERPPPASAPTGSSHTPLPLPETAFQDTRVDGSGVATVEEDRFTTRRIGAGGDAEGHVSYGGSRIDLDVKAADLHDVFRLIADVGKVNIVVAGDVSGTITLKLKGVPWDQALDVVVRAKGLAVEREGNVIIVHAR